MKLLVQLLLVATVAFVGCQSDASTEGSDKNTPDVPEVQKITNDKIILADGSELALPAGETTIFMVRHAEKINDGSNDPGLTAPGKERATKLNNLLADVNLGAVLSTATRRSMETARPTAESHSLDPFGYDMDNTNNIYKFIFEYEKGKKFLMVGHSNTIPVLVDELVSDSTSVTIPEEQYDRLYVLVGGGKDACKVYEYKY
ncbi:MAG: histidine phosphatase family protein [Saprospiraceae bacterium]